MSPESDRTDGLVLAGLAVGTGVVTVVWLTGEFAALFRYGRWPAVSPSAAVAAVARLPVSVRQPAWAWPRAVRPQLPRSPWWYLAGGAASIGGVLTVVLAATWLARHVRLSERRVPVGPAGGRPARAGWSPRVGSRDGGRVTWPVGRRMAPGAYWASRRDVRLLRIDSTGGNRMVLGRVGRVRVATESRHSVLVLGPTQSGKTTALAIPALLEWHGPVIATSVKDDLVSHTRTYRARLGRTWIFDPTGAVRGDRRSTWSPLAGASTWGGAQRVAQALVVAAPAHTGLSDGAFWYQASAKLLAPLLLAAERGRRPMADVVRWTNLQETEEVRFLLEVAGETEALLALHAGQCRDDRIRSSIYTTLETVLAPYEDPVVAASAAGSDIDPAELLAGCNTLYLCGPAHEQARVQGVFSALVAAAVHAAVTRYERHGPLDPPLLVLLDEAANVAPFPDLDTLASTAAGMGIQLMTVCQDLSQLASRYGPERARTIFNNHRAKVALSGIADVGTLDTLSGLAGEAAVREQTFTSDHRDGRRSTSSSISYRRLVPAEQLRRVRPGHGVLIYGYLPPARLVLRPWYQDRELRRRVHPP